MLLPLEGTALLPPIRRPGLILTCEKIELVGRESLETAIMKSPNSVVGDAAHINVPWPDASRLTGQTMLGAVVGRPAYRVDKREARDAIAGFTLVADLSLPAPAENCADSWQAYVESKQFPGSCPMGPAIVTTDEVPDPCQLSITTSVNGVDAAAGPAVIANFDLAKAIAKLSHTYGLRPGDVIAFGQGFGSGRLQLRENDRVCADLGGLMTLSFEVAFR